MKETFQDPILNIVTLSAVEPNEGGIIPGEPGVESGFPDVGD